MSTVYRFSESEIPHFITMTLVEWVDLFNRKDYKDILIDNLKYCIEHKGLVVHAYVIMSNHAHLVVRTRNGEKLSNVVRDFKRYTAKVIYEKLKTDKQESRRNWMLWIFESQGARSSSNEHMKIWRHENHPVPLDHGDMLESRISYIHENPVRAGICFEPAQYVYSSACDYEGHDGLLKIELI